MTPLIKQFYLNFHNVNIEVNAFCRFEKLLNKQRHTGAP